MKYKTLVRLALKLIGVFLIVSAIPTLVGAGIQVAAILWNFGGPQLGWWIVSSVGGELVQIAIGLHLLLGGKWIAHRLVPSNRPYCHECGYELTGLALEGVCPECGTEYQRSEGREVPPPR